MDQGRLKFDEIEDTGKTKKWNVTSNARLGVVRWHAPWRRYVFHASFDSIFDASCLQEIETFMNEQMEARKAA
jgi:hypothetical protein